MDNKFSPRENEILEALGRKKMMIAELTDLIFKKGSYEKNNLIAGTIRRINRKCKLHELDWMIQGEGSGRHGRTVWKEKV